MTMKPIETLSRELIERLSYAVEGETHTDAVARIVWREVLLWLTEPVLAVEVSDGSGGTEVQHMTLLELLRAPNGAREAKERLDTLNALLQMTNKLTYSALSRELELQIARAMALRDHDRMRIANTVCSANDPLLSSRLEAASAYKTVIEKVLHDFINAQKKPVPHGDPH